MYGKHYQSCDRSPDWENIINSCNQLDLWSWFFSFRAELGQPICNPLRVDKHPNCWLSWGSSNASSKFIVMNDHAHREFHGYTVFRAMMYAYGMKFNEVCQKILEEFIIPGKIEMRESPAYFNEQPKFTFILDYVPWTLNGREVYIKHDKEFWEQYGISSADLRMDNVKSNRRIIYNSRQNPTSFTALDVTPSYTYLFGQRKKCYQPYSDKKVKWKSTCTEEDIGGIGSIKRENLIITKSYKDWRVLLNSGYNSIWLQNEGCKIPFERLIQLQEIPTKYILFDNDQAGIRASQELADYCNQFDNSYIPLHFDVGMPKDSADVVRKYSNQVLEQELSNLGIQ